MAPRCHRAGALACLLVASLFAANAAAQKEPSSPPTAAATKEARLHFARGATLYGEGDYGGALAEFQRAYELGPRWQVLFNIGQSYFQLRDYANALRTLRRFAAEGGDRIDKEDRATLEAELPELANRVARVSIVTNVEGAKVWIDDQPLGTIPLHEPLLVSAGQRRVALTLEGRPAVEQRVTVVGGDETTLRLEFPPPAGSPNPALASAPSPRPAPPGRVPAIVSLVLGAAGVAVGSTFGVLAIQQKADLDRVCRANGGCPPSSAGDIASLMRDGTISTIGFSVGAAGTVAGMVLWLVSPSSHDAHDADDLRIGPGFVAGSF